MSMASTDIGVVSEHRGTGCQIERDRERLSGERNSIIRSMDIYHTEKCVSNIRFRDDTQVRVTENSRLLIDDFVFDPKQSDAGRLAIRVGMGTVRYASGQIAKNNPQRVNIKTPTATVAVRGTDFTMTVDETGESLIVLVPSCRENERPKTYELEENTCRVGQIDVTTLGGTVTLEQAFEATYVRSISLPPTPPTVLNTVESGIGNNLILVKPGEIRRAIQQSRGTEQENEIEEDSAVNNKNSNDDESEITEINLIENKRPTRTICNSVTTICVRWEGGDEQTGRGVAYRTLDNEHHAQVKTQGYFSNTKVTIVHNDNLATHTIGDGSPDGNTVVIRQSTGVLRR